MLAVDLNLEQDDSFGWTERREETINTLVIGLAYRVGATNVAQVRRRWAATVTQGLTRLWMLRSLQQQSQIVTQGCLRA